MWLLWAAGGDNRYYIHTRGDSRGRTPLCREGAFTGKEKEALGSQPRMLPPLLASTPAPLVRCAAPCFMPRGIRGDGATSCLARAQVLLIASSSSSSSSSFRRRCRYAKLFYYSVLGLGLGFGYSVSFPRLASPRLSCRSLNCAPFPRGALVALAD